MVLTVLSFACWIQCWLQCAAVSAESKVYPVYPENVDRTEPRVYPVLPHNVARSANTEPRMYPSNAARMHPSNAPSNAAKSVHSVSVEFPSNSVVKSRNGSDTMEIVIGTSYNVLPIQPQNYSEDVHETGRRNSPEEDVYLIGQKEACRRNIITSCITYNVFTYIQNLLEHTSTAITSGRSVSEDSPQLVSMPVTVNTSRTLLGRSYWGLGELYLYLERQLSRFIQSHGVVFPASDWAEASAKHFSTPVLLDGDKREVEDGRDSRGKTKQKSILFPLLILFKFFKIKMILVPILLTVLLVKKLLIISLAIAPSLIGFFRVCRPTFNPPIGLAPAGLLQDVPDSRGEFSSLYNTYIHPYRDAHRYRTRDFPRYSGGGYAAEPPQHPTPDPSSDY